MDRRTFIIAASALTGGFALSFWLPELFKSSDRSASLNDIQYNFIQSVQQHLFPKHSESPGADDIYATDYLQFVLADPNVNAEDRQLIINGIGWLEKVCQKQFNSFAVFVFR